MAMEAARAFQFIFQTLNVAALTNAGSTGVYKDLAPIKAVAPFVTISMQSSPDTTTLNGFRIMTRPLMRIVAVGYQEQFATLVAIADEIDTLLTRQSGDVGSVHIYSCVRESEVNLTQLLNSETWSYIGGLYRTFAL